MNFGQKLVKLRKENGMSQEELSSKIFVSRQAISRWENNDVLPDAEHILQISKLFAVSTDYLLNDDYESGKDIPIVKETSDLVKLEQQRHSTFLLLLGGLFIFATGLVAGIYLKHSWLVVTGVIGQVIFMITFEITFTKYCSLHDTKRWKRRFYRIAVWMLAVFPAYAITELFFSWYPRPYSGLWLYILFGAVYLLICTGVNCILKAKA